MIGVSTGLRAHLWHIVILGVWPPIFGLVVVIDRLRHPARRVGTAAIPEASGRATPGRAAQDRSVGRLALSSTPAGPRGADPASPSRRRSGDAWYQLTAVGCVCAAGIHMSVMPDHFTESLWYGGFFLVTALAEVLLGVLILVRPTRRLLLSVVLGTTAVVALWLGTRVIGVPIGPDNGGTEPFGVLDILASIIEAVTALCAARALAVGRARPTWRWSQWSVAVRAVTPVCLVGTALASLLASRS